MHPAASDSAPTEFANEPSANLLAPGCEAKLFQRLRWRIFKSVLEHTLRTARLRATLVVLLSFLFWFGLLVLFLKGFQFLPISFDEHIQTLFSVFFASLMVMLTFSSAILMYGGLYRSAESAFLLTTPARPERIVFHKFQETIWFSGWAFLLLGSPLLIAHGAVSDAPWHYFALLLPFMIAFVYLQTALGALGCLLLVRYFPRRRITVLVLLATFVIGSSLWIGWTAVRSSEHELLTLSGIREVLGRLRGAEIRLLPSWWLSTGLIEASRQSQYGSASYQPWAQSVLFLTLLVANGLFAQMLALMAAKRVYRSSYSTLFNSDGVRRGVRAIRFDRWALERTVLLPRNMRLLILKDFRIFRRDPLQWTQALIFLGLLGLYFVNIPRFRYNMNEPSYINMIGFLNLAVVGLILSTFTTRFIYPLISLEGQRFWILSLLPVSRSTIVWSKFVFAALGTTLPCLPLILLSDTMLGLSWLVTIAHLVTCLVLCCGLSAIAVGLGARVPDLRQTCPSKIAAGFGGTLNLVFSVVFIVVAVLLVAVPTQRYLTMAGPKDIRLVLAGMAATSLLGILVTLLSLRMGLRAFRLLEA